MATSCGPAPAEQITLSGTAMGTGYRLTVPRDVAADGSLYQEVRGLLERLEDQMSTYREGSEISRFNRSPDTGGTTVSREFGDVVRRAVEIAGESGGTLDIAVGPLVRLWDPVRARVPSAAEIATARALTGPGAVRVEPGERSSTLYKSDPSVEIDLSAVAKGYAVDEVAALLDRRGVEAYLVEIGGEVRTAGAKPDGSPWRVGIESPVPGERSVYAVVPLSDQPLRFSSMATSGDYRNFFTGPDGKRYSHVIDPRTGRPVDHTLSSVTVVATDCTTADAWATALLVLGPDEGLAMAEAQGLDALFLVNAGEADDGRPQFDRIETSGFRELVGENR